MQEILFYIVKIGLYKYLTKLHFSTLAQAYVFFDVNVEYHWNPYDKPLLMAGSKPGLAKN